MKIDERVYLVASDALGVSMSTPFDCNVYLLDGGSHYALIDAGVGEDPTAIVEQIVRDGLDAKKVRDILLTHGNLDHAGGCRVLHDRFHAGVI